MRLIHELVMRPMGAMKVTPDQLPDLKYPLYVSPKLDGVRCVIKNGFPLSRRLIKLPNRRLQRMLSYCPEGFEGELILGHPLSENVFNKTQGCVMSQDEPVDNIHFHLFDNWGNEKTPFEARFNGLKLIVENLRNRGHDHLHVIEHTLARNADDVMELEARYVDMGYEGIMLRSPKAHYKFGIATLRKAELLKIKRWLDTEARIVGFLEMMGNGSEPEINGLGYIKRLKRKSTAIPLGVLGAFICELPSGVQFKLGNGFSFEQRAALWQVRELLLDKWVTFKYQEMTAQGKPRSPSFLHFRDEIDFVKGTE